MQKIRSKTIGSSILVAVVALTLTAVFALTGGAQSQSASDAIYNPAGGEIVFPRVQIIQWRDTAGRFDSATGEILRFHGDLDDPQVKPTWAPDVPPVRGRSSGMLRIQHPVGPRAVDAPFLVDVVTGDTWLLQMRGTGATWERVETTR